MLAVAITAIEAGIAGRYRFHDEPSPERLVAATIVLERAAPKPRSTPRPTPVPTPAPLVRATLAPIQRAAPRPIAHRHIARPKAAGPAGMALADGSGAGSAAGAGSGSGAGDDAGAGASNGTEGTGTGAVNADTPCGYVEFLPDDEPRIVGNVSYETIRATVHYPDGRVSSDDFPYPWVYPDYMDTDPWSPINVRRTDLVVFAQLPPPGANASRYSDLIRYILAHTNPNGGTVLQPCPP